MYVLVWFGLVLWHINYGWLFNAKSCLYIYIKCMISKHILDHIFIQLNDQTSLFQAVKFSMSHLFALTLNAKVLSLNVKQFYLTHR